MLILFFVSLEANLVCMPKMMLPATQTSCLKDSHTNFQLNVGIGITYFGDISIRMPKLALEISNLSV
jgi:hypothetical protein